jgi:hypothetical protein
MSALSSMASSSFATVAPDLSTPVSAAPRGMKAAREFEAHLIGSLLESLEKTFASVPGETAVPGKDDYDYLGTRALAAALADRGGFGIAAMISRAFPGHEGNG